MTKIRMPKYGHARHILAIISIFFHEIFRINAGLNFALNLLVGFFWKFSKKIDGQILNFPWIFKNLAVK